MAAGELLTRALFISSHQFSLLPNLRRMSNAAAAGGNLKPCMENSVSLIDFLRGRGLGDEGLTGFAPHLLDSKVGKVLPAKFDLLLAIGFSVPEAAKFLRHQDLLKCISLISLQRRLDALRAIIPDDADLRRIINRASWTLYSHRKIERMVDTMSRFRGWGVSESKIKSLLVSHPRFFQSKPQCLEEAADRAVAEFGFRRDCKVFIDGVLLVWSTKESTRESKFKVFESFGWDRSAVHTLFTTYPNWLRLSEATLITKLDFFIKKVGLDPSSIIKNPAMLGYSLEKRVRPRFELLSALKSKNLLPKRQSFYHSWCMSEADFMEKYVVKFMKEEPTICNAYINTVASRK